MAEIVTCRLADAEVEETYKGFRDALCEGRPRTYALVYSGADGLRCKLENSGRCLDPDTPWRMVRFIVEPMLRFDPTTEWVAILPVKNWKQRCDAALQASLQDGRPWGRILAEELAGEMESVPHLRITR